MTAYTDGFDYDIFISFSHFDNQPPPGTSGEQPGWIEAYREDIQTWLTGRGLRGLKVWWDIERLNGNTDFDQRIEHDLGRTALFFVIHSQNYRQSDYCQKELGWFVEQAGALQPDLTVDGNHRIFNILINNIPYREWEDPTHWTFPLKGSTGFKCHDAKKDDDFGDPLYQHTAPDQYRAALGKVVDAAYTTLRALHTRSRPPSTPPPDTHPPRVTLTLDADKNRLQRRYRIAGGAAETLTVGDDWPALRARLERREPAGSDDRDISDALYQALFGPPEVKLAEHIIKAATPSTLVHPWHQPLDLRIAIATTADPLLSTLPWQLTGRDGSALVDKGWTFALTTALDAPLPDLDCHLPGRVLAYIPPGTDVDHSALHYRQFEARLNALWPDQRGLRVQRIEHWPPTALPQNVPCLLYVAAPAAVQGEQLRLGYRSGPTPADLVADLGQISILLLNLELDPAAATHHRLDLPEGRCQLAITQLHSPDQRDDAEARALDWLQVTLSTRQHPIAAANQRLLDSTRVDARFAAWRPRIDQAPNLSRHERARLLLDRLKQRDRLFREVNDLADSRHARVLAAFAYGEPGNLAERFGDQVHETLARSRLPLRIHRHTVRLPAIAAITKETLRSALFQALHGDPQQDLARLLEQRRPPAPPGWRGLLMLTWHRDAGSDPVPASRAGEWDEDARREWEAFCHSALPTACPNELRILTLLPLTVESATRDEIEDQVDALRDNDHGLGYQLLQLPALSAVETDEVRTFLRKEVPVPCPPDLVRTLPRMIVCDASGGASAREAPFEATADRLERGLEHGWDLLEDELKQHGADTRCT